MDLEAVLEEMGHTVAGVAAHAGRALEMIEARHAQLDLALIDIRLAGETARPVADALDAHGIPYVAVTGLDVDEVRSLGFHGGYVTKPCLAPQLETAIRATLARAEG